MFVNVGPRNTDAAQTDCTFCTCRAASRIEAKSQRRVPAAIMRYLPLGSGVIGSTTDSDSVSRGSSPCSPAAFFIGCYLGRVVAIPERVGQLIALLFNVVGHRRGNVRMSHQGLE